VVDLPIEILRCPVTGGPLTLRDGALVTADGRLAYPVEDGIAALLPDRAVALEADAVAAGLRAEKRAVQSFYDEVGWRQDDDEVFEDTARFVDTRPVVDAYQRECRRRIGRLLGPGGDYLVDIACGPVQFPEYVAYQERFGARICIDFSRRALLAAQRNVGDKGVLIQGDITSIPLRDDSVDCVVSLHTIYHVPRDEQHRAFCEVHRVLKPGGVAVVAYSWGHTAWEELSTPRKLAHLPVRVARRVRRAVAARRAPAGAASGGADEPALYFHAFDHHWFVHQAWPFEAEIVNHHVFTSRTLARLVRERAGGRLVLAAIRAFEERFPHLAGRVGRYPLIVIRKAV